MTLPSEIQNVLLKIERAGFRAYLVGGAVRDHFLGRETHDYDMTTDANPEKIKEIFSFCKTVDIGAAHGTIGVVLPSYTVEITAMRTDGSYRDARHPDKVFFGSSLVDDLSRRDFTINAIAYHPKEGFIDPFGGIADIKAKILRTVGEPEKRFSEDALRILRAIRFSSVLGFEMEERTNAAILSAYEKLRAISAERIFSELCGIVCGQNVKAALLDFSCVICFLIPELQKTVGYDQNNENHSLTLYEHTVTAVSHAEAKLPIRLAMLLHDIGKPEVMTKDADGISHYKGHEEVGAGMAEEILRRLRAPKALISEVSLLIRLHDRRIKDERAPLLRFVREAGGYARARDILGMQRADILSQAPQFLFRLKQLDALLSHLKEAEKNGDAVFIHDLKVNGNDVRQEGFAGQETGAVLSELLEAVITGAVENKRNSQLIWLREKKKIKASESL